LPSGMSWHRRGFPLLTQIPVDIIPVTSPQTVVRRGNFFFSVLPTSRVAGHFWHGPPDSSSGSDVKLFSFLDERSLSDLSCIYLLSWFDFATLRRFTFSLAKVLPFGSDDAVPHGPLPPPFYLVLFLLTLMREFVNLPFIRRSG